jgi:rhamnogalacturonyl hydrolase YesR
MEYFDRFDKLKTYLEKESFKGWDPYDGLNSKVFQTLPLKHWDIARWVWIQFFKRSPVNLRKLLLVPKEYNNKGLGLLLTAYCNLYEINEKLGEKAPYTQRSIKDIISLMADHLLCSKSDNPESASWGYNFDWQARRLFLFPRNTPNVVTTYFVFYGLIQAYEVTQKEEYLTTALSSANFVLNQLKRTPSGSGFLFSYSSLDGNNTVYNASLLAAKILSHCYYYTQNNRYKDAAKETIKACVEAQNPDGSWYYGVLSVQRWIDSFHTGYNLDALVAYQDFCDDNTFAQAFDKGFTYYLETFFHSDGKPKYYHNQTYPIDIHCPAQLFVTLHRSHRFQQHQELAKRVMHWTLDNMQDKKGYFYYQKKPIFSSKISYMRWSNAFMFYAMSYFMKETLK